MIETTLNGHPIEWYKLDDGKYLVYYNYVFIKTEEEPVTDQMIEAEKYKNTHKLAVILGNILVKLLQPLLDRRSEN